MTDKNNDSQPVAFKIHFTPDQLLAEAEARIKDTFRATALAQISAHFGEHTEHDRNQPLGSQKPRKIAGAGLLQIREFLEKKFDDPATHAWMERFFETNFESIMSAAMQKACEHKANGVVFGKVKEQ